MIFKTSLLFVYETTLVYRSMMRLHCASERVQIARYRARRATSYAGGKPCDLAVGCKLAVPRFDTCSRCGHSGAMSLVTLSSATAPPST